MEILPQINTPMRKIIVKKKAFCNMSQVGYQESLVAHI